MYSHKYICRCPKLVIKLKNYRFIKQVNLKNLKKNIFIVYLRREIMEIIA